MHPAELILQLVLAVVLLLCKIIFVIHLVDDVEDYLSLLFNLKLPFDLTVSSIILSSLIVKFLLVFVVWLLALLVSISLLA